MLFLHIHARISCRNTHYRAIENRIFKDHFCSIKLMKGKITIMLVLMLLAAIFSGIARSDIFQPGENGICVKLKVPKCCKAQDESEATLITNQGFFY